MWYQVIYLFSLKPSQIFCMRLNIHYVVVSSMTLLLRVSQLEAHVLSTIYAAATDSSLIIFQQIKTSKWAVDQIVNSHTFMVALVAKNEWETTPQHFCVAVMLRFSCGVFWAAVVCCCLLICCLFAFFYFDLFYQGFLFRPMKSWPNKLSTKRLYNWVVCTLTANFWTRTKSFH